MSRPFIANPLIDSGSASPTGYDLLVPILSNEVYRNYLDRHFVANMVRKETIESGREKKVTYVGELGYYSVEEGHEHYGLDRQQIQRTITLYDRPIGTAYEHEDLIPMLEQVNTRTPIAASIAYALSEAMELETMKNIAIAARTAPPGNDATEFLGGGFDADGTAETFSYALNATGARAFLTKLDALQLNWTKRNIPVQGRACIVSPDLWQQIRLLPELIAPASNTHYSSPGGVGVFENPAAGGNMGFMQYGMGETPLMYRGLPIYAHTLWSKFQALPVTNQIKNIPAPVSGGVGTFANTQALIWQQESMCMVEKMGVDLRIERPSRTDNVLIRARMWLGSGVLRPEGAVELQSA